MPEIKAGIWIDQKKAFIVRVAGEEYPLLLKIESKVESRVVKPGDAGIDKRSDNAFIDDQEKKQRRQRSELKHFFKEIISYLKDTDYIYLFGPGMAKEGLKNAIEVNQHLIKAKMLELENADKMTQKMIVQKTVAFFGTEEFRLYRKRLRKQKELV